MHDLAYIEGKWVTEIMLKPIAKLLEFFTQIFFTVLLVLLLLLPKFLEIFLARRILAFCFGRLLVSRYHRVIEFYGASYGAALEIGLEKAAHLCATEVNRVLDCGTGTGFVSRQAVLRFPQAMVIATDATFEMLQQSLQSSIYAHPKILRICADSHNLPLPDGAVDLVLAQNTIPFLTEFARVCRPGGFIVFVDSAAGWVAPTARLAARRTGCFDMILTAPAGLGFYLVARRAQPHDVFCKSSD